MSIQIQRIAIIGGSGFSALFSDNNETDKNVQIANPFYIKKRFKTVSTPYGDIDGLVQLYSNDQTHPYFRQKHELYFIPRHGQHHSVPPHKINYRALIDALNQTGISAIIATHAVGGITASCKPEALVLPSQAIDYTYSREHTFYNDFKSIVSHIDFSYPFAGKIYQSVLHTINTAHKRAHNEIVVGGCYGCTQGPRLETSAEIQRLKQDGCDIVGMTAMPEAVLAREKAIDYTSISMVVNWAAGIEQAPIKIEDIIATLNKTTSRSLALIHDVLKSVVVIE